MDYYTVYLIGSIIVCITIYSWYSRWATKKKNRKKLLDNWGVGNFQRYFEGDLENIASYFNHKKSTQFYVDDITWNDLEMDDVFKEMNHTMSSAGEEYLYYMLRTPILDEVVLKKRNKKMLDFEEDVENRLSLQMLLQKLDKRRNHSISNIVFNTMEDYHGIPIPIVQLLSIISILLPIVFFLFPQIGNITILVFTIFPLNMWIYYRARKQIDQNIYSIRYIINLIGLSKKCIPYIKDQENQTKIKALYKEVKTLSSIRFKFLYPSNASEDIIGAILDYIRIITLIDLFMYSKIIQLISKKNTQIKEIYEILGELDALISISSYRAGSEEYTMPVFHNEESSFITFVDAYHPLISKPIKNSLNRAGSILITGANASGKSTFLKTLGLNQIFAQSIYTVLAKSYETKMVRVYSAMSVKDNILNNESYYIAEIKAVKRILDEVKKQDQKVLCIVDELLKGTNTKERIVGAFQILSYLSNYCYVYAATHDIELTDLLKEKMDNYHFQSKILDNEIHFDYLIKEGKSMDTNAIELLRIFDFDEEIIVKSKEMLKGMM